MATISAIVDAARTENLRITFFSSPDGIFMSPPPGFAKPAR
jgi:hypothetical protein